MADLQVVNQGSVFLFIPYSEAGTAFLKDELSSEPWQWMGGALAVEHRFAADIAGLAQDAGLEVE